MDDKPLLLFDMDGTLIKMQEQPKYHRVSTNYPGYTSLRAKMKEVAISHGVPRETIVNLNRMAHIWNKTRGYAESNGFEADKIRRLMNAVNGPFREEESADHQKSILIPETIETLQTLREEGFKMGLVTTASRDAYENLSNNPEFGCFGQYFDYSITRDDCRYIKPYPEPIHRIQKLFKHTNFIYIGDSDHDAEATKAAGGTFILINTRKYDEETIKRLNPYAVIDNPKELVEIIEKLA